MIEPLLLMYERNLDYARRLVADVPEARMVEQPRPGMNHAAWVLGHLAQTAAVYGSLLGVPVTPRAEWGPLFGGKSKPQADAALYPAKAVLLEALETGHARNAEATRRQPAAFWTQPPVDEHRRSRFPTMGHLLVHMLVNHEAIHLGQLSAWRRALGLPPV